MKKNCFMLISILIMILLLSACSNDANCVQESDEYNKFTSSLLFTSGDSRILERVTEEFTYEDIWERIILASNRKCCLVNDWARVGEIGENKFYNDFYLYDYASGEFQVFECNEIPDSTRYLAAMNDEKVVLFDLYAGILYVYDFNAKLLTQSDVLSDTAVFANTSELQCDGDYIYLTFGSGMVADALYVLDYDLTLLDTKTSEKGWRLFPNYEKTCLIADSVNSFYEFDGEKGLQKVDYKLSLPDDFNFESDSVFTGDTTYDFYVKYSYYGDEGNKSTCDLVGVRDGIGYKVFSPEQMGFVKEDLNTVIPVGTTGYIVGKYNISMDVMEYYLLEPCDEVMDYSIGNGKTVLRIAGLFAPAELRKTVNAFNLSSDSYYIELVEYSQKYEDVEDALNALYIDVATQKSVDGIVLLELDKSDLVENDLLMDLSEYFSGEHVVSAEDYEPFVWESMKDKEGKITSVYPEFTITGLLSANDISLDNLQSYKELSNEEKFLFAESDSLSLFRELMKYSGSRFINEEAKEVYFDEDFIVLLEVLKEEEQRKKDSYSFDSPTAVLEGDALALYEELAIPYSYAYYKYLFDTEFVCTNFGVDAPVLVPGTTEIGITTYSEHKEGMYAFLDYMFTEEVYHRYYGQFRFPVLQSFWDDWMIRVTATETYTDRFNEQILAGNFTYGFNDVVVTLGSMSEEEASKMKTMVESAVYMEPVNVKYLAIMEEEVQSYLYGDKTAEEVCEVLERRILTAIKEG